ncbi:MAG: hypothetical protein EOP53_15450 [Sphingobacteriales bacterium]|nr:MAG: hypothetical protein EOP53_15450 [Sphingobacteriales bacterium]
MSKLPFLLLFIPLVNTCNQASQQQAQKCPEKACTMMFASIPVKFVDNNGQPAAVKNYKAVNLRTKEDITHQDNSNTTGSFFAVADDSDLKKLTEAGDDIEVTATDSASNKQVSGIIKVSGGVCACHVARISGPEEIKVN